MKFTQKGKNSLSIANRTCLGLVLLGPMVSYKVGNFSFSKNETNKEYIHQTNESHFYLQEAENDWEADSEKQVKSNVSFIGKDLSLNHYRKRIAPA